MIRALGRTAGLALALAGGATAQGTGGAPDREVEVGEPQRPHLEAALEAARWLGTVAVEFEGGWVGTVGDGAQRVGLAWPADPARSTEPGWTLYAGTPGVVLFHLELAAASGDERWLATARRGAEALVAWVQDELDASPAGLYTGSAGVAFALAETWRATGAEQYRGSAQAVLEHLHATARPTAAGVRWSEVTDVIGGDAGVGFLLLHTARALERPADLELAAAAGRELVARAEARGEGLDWAMSPTYPRRMPNFSHGTAGVATFLAALFLQTGEQAFLEAALGGARHLLAIADRSREGLKVHHHTPDGEQLFYLGWCHGPTGTARLFRALGRATGEDSWRALERAAAHTLLTAGLPAARPDGYWNNVGPCCGAAGVAAFLLDVHGRFEDEWALALARGLSADILERGTPDGAGLRWEHAEHRVRPEYLSTQTGWMQGAAGIGHWLLVLDAFERGREVVVRLPDDRY